MTVECRIVPGEDEFELMTDVMMRSMKAVKVQRIGMAAVTVLALAAAVYCLVGAVRGTGEGYFFHMMTAVFLGVTLFCGYWLKAGLRKKMIAALRRANMALENKERQYIFNEDIRIHTEKKDSVLKWEDVQGWGEDGRLIYLRFAGQFVIVDKNQIVRGSAAEFRKMLLEHGLDEKKEIMGRKGKQA